MILVLARLSDIESIGGIDKMLDTWFTLFLDTVNKHTPIRTYRVKKNIQPDWLDSEILEKMKEGINKRKIEY